MIFHQVFFFCFQIVKMMMTLVVIFGVCWLPYHIYFILSYTNPQINHSRYIQVGLLFTFTLVLFWASRAPLEQSYFPYYFRKSISQFTGWLCPIQCTTLWSTASWTIGENTLDGNRFGFKTLRIYISAHFVSTSFKFNVCWQAWFWEKEAFSKTKIKGDSENSNFGGKTSMHKSTSIDFF